MIWFNGFPFLDNKEEHSFGVPVSAVMIRDLVLLPSVGLKLDEVEAILAETSFGGFPVVQDRDSKVLLGYIGRTELKYAIGNTPLSDRYTPTHPFPRCPHCICFSSVRIMLIQDRAKRLRRVSPTAMCYFSTPDQDTRPYTHTRSSSLPIQIPTGTPLSQTPTNPIYNTTSDSDPNNPDPFPFEPVSSLDFAQYIDSTPLTIHPHLPLETVMEMFKKLGPRVVLVELRGRVCGLITVKDVLKYQFKVENEEHPRVDRESGVEERLWEAIETLGRRVGGLWSRIRTRGAGGRGRPVLSESVVEEEEVELVDQPHSPR